MITSTSNGQIKKIQQLLKKSRTRKEEGFSWRKGSRCSGKLPGTDRKDISGGFFCGKRNLERDPSGKGSGRKSRKSDGSRGGQSV